MNAKTLFVNNKELRNQWLAVAKQEWFKTVLLHTRGVLTETEGITPEALKGAKQFENILLTICDEDEETPNEFTPRLAHDLDNPRAKPQTKNRKKAK